MTAQQTPGAPAPNGAPPIQETGDIVEDAIAEFEATRASRKSAEEQPPEGDEPPEKAEEKPDEEENSPGWVAKAREELKKKRVEMDREYVELKKRAKREKAQREEERREYANFKNIRDSFNQDLRLVTEGTTEQALNALTRIRAASGQKGEDFLSEANLAVARNGKKKEPDPEIVALRNEIAELRKEREGRDKQATEAQQNQALERRRAEVADAVCAPTNAVAGQLSATNRTALRDMAIAYKSAYWEARKSELPDAEAAKLVERDLAPLAKHPRVLAYAKLGNLGQIVQTVVNLRQSEGLDDAAAIGKIDGILAANLFGGAPAPGGLGRATQAQAEPVEPESESLPGRTVSSTRANASAGSERKLTKEERLAQLVSEGVLEDMGITFLS
ncbi:MAG TPA: hypothetical protein VFZ21_30975 [Gemmatimonadaceae bacterium]|nr:hypothetical protein [Gemmatimonadaceae bacterium]